MPDLMLKYHYRAMFGDTFIDVDANSDEEAQKFARCQLIQQLEDEHFIVWRTGEIETTEGKESAR